MGDDYCKIFVDFSESRDVLSKAIQRVVGGTVQQRTVVSEICEVDVIRNEDFDESKRDSNDGFIYFPYYLDITKVDAASKGAFLDHLKKLLHHFWSTKVRAVPACSFEVELPEAP